MTKGSVFLNLFCYLQSDRDTSQGFHDRGKLCDGFENIMFQTNLSSNKCQFQLICASKIKCLAIVVQEVGKYSQFPFPPPGSAHVTECRRLESIFFFRSDSGSSSTPMIQYTCGGVLLYLGADLKGKATEDSAFMQNAAV